jgi:hypothetical protein
MPVPDIFADGDPSEAKLAGYFEEMYDFLLEEGVPEDRLPGPWHMLSRMVKCIDPELFREWLDAYVAVESEDNDDEDDEDEIDPSPQPRPKPKRRPDYLRAIQSQTEGDPSDGQTEEASGNDGTQ